jgi:formylglycine-generating enzyme required for sulfatase activity
MAFVYINDPGVDGHEPFNGYMSKYETTNAQYCEFLNAALASGDITVDANIVYGANGSNPGVDFVGEIYFDTYAADSNSQITCNGGVFSIRIRDSNDMSNHPVVMVSWYGATAFCNYYGYRLPTEWEWQAVADHNGTFTYGCGTTIDHSKANYGLYNPLGLSIYPYTSPVNYYPSYGYGMNDMAGNVFDWTSTVSAFPVLRGGGWQSGDFSCTVSIQGVLSPSSTDNYVGFRVCR